MLKWVFGADTRPFSKGLDKMRGETQNFSKKAGSMIAGVFALGSIMAGIKSLIDQFARIDDLAKRFGESAETMQRVGQAAVMAGSDVEAVARAMTAVTKNAYNAAQGSDEMSKAFSAMGLDASNFINLPMEEKMILLAKAMESGKGDGEKLAQVMKILGKSGGDMIPILNQGSEALKKQFDETSVASQSSVDAIAKIDDAWEGLKNTVAVFFANLIEPLKTFGRAIGAEFAVAAAVVMFLGKQIVKLGTLISATMSGDIKKMKSAIRDLTTGVKEDFQNLKTDLGNILDEVNIDVKIKQDDSEVVKQNQRLAELSKERLTTEQKILDIKKEMIDAEEKARQGNLTAAERLLELEEKKAALIAQNEVEESIRTSNEKTSFDTKTGLPVAGTLDKVGDAESMGRTAKNNEELAQIEKEISEAKREKSGDEKKAFKEAAKKAGEAIMEFAEKVKQLNDDIAQLDADKAGIIKQQAFDKMSDKDKVKSLQGDQAALNAQAIEAGKKGDKKTQREKEIAALELNPEIDALKEQIEAKKKKANQSQTPVVGVSSLASIGGGGSANLLSASPLESKKVSLLEQIANNTSKSDNGNTKNPEPV